MGAARVHYWFTARFGLLAIPCRLGLAAFGERKVAHPSGNRAGGEKSTPGFDLFHRTVSNGLQDPA